MTQTPKGAETTRNAGASEAPRREAEAEPKAQAAEPGRNGSAGLRERILPFPFPRCRIARARWPAIELAAARARGQGGSSAMGSAKARDAIAGRRGQRPRDRSAQGGRGGQRDRRVIGRDPGEGAARGRGAWGR